MKSEFSFKEAMYPLNSKHITLTQLCQLAQALDLPVAASSAYLQIMVEAKLRELEQEPKNMQLVVSETLNGSQQLKLQDESGTFLKLLPRPVWSFPLLLKYLALILH